MDWKTMKEIIDDMVSAKVKVQILEMENVKLREDKEKLCEEKEKLKEENRKLNEEKDKHVEFYRNIRVEAVASPVIIGDLVNEVIANEVIENVEEIRTVIVEESEETKRKTYMRNYMKEKRKSDKDAKKLKSK